MLKVNLTTFLFLYFFVIVNAQVDTLYNLGNNPNILSWEAIEEKMEAVRRNSITNEEKDEYLVRFDVMYEKRKADTLIQFGSINIIALELLSEADRLANMLNKQMPDFDFVDIDGNRANSKDLKDRVIFLNFWFTRCAPCIAEMPELNQIKEMYKNQEIAFISMAPEEESLIKAFLKKHPFTFQHIADADDFLKLFGTGFPKNILIDKEGIIRYIGGGLVSVYAKNHDNRDLSESVILEKLEELLSKK